MTTKTTKPMTQPTEKVCFRYDGSEAAKEAYKVWDRLKRPLADRPSSGIYYHSNGEGHCVVCEEYHLVTPYDFLRIVKGESEAKWKVGDKCAYNGMPVGTIRNGEIIAIYEDVAWVKIPETKNPVVISISSLKSVRKSLRKEVAEIIGQEKSDQIFQLIKQRKDEI